ncbi:CsgG/HfaB family protein [Cytophagaceae bacterium DM2B3-1]|uniref:CsgG/HfaB family protein n=1 Tax=Xanthocytophaga flava TaxID=3048013 RepID=A0ABT7CSN8_9BACT|nr:CsgG/HfaB family protein [Xanthocytophaga flavus]
MSNMNSVKILLSLVFICLYLESVLAQEGNTTIAIVKFLNTGASTERANQRIINYQTYVSMTFLKDKRFTVLERDNLSVIDKERELQKTENFIDGKIIQQGISIGANYIITGSGDPSQRLVTVKLYDVVAGNLLGTDIINFEDEVLLDNGVLSHSDLNDIMVKIVNKQFLYKYFPLPSIKVVRILEEGKKGAEKLLIAAGSKDGITRKKQFLIKEKVYEEVDGKQIERDIVLGKVKISEVENEFFSVASLEDGTKLITEKIKKGTKLFCMPID